MFSTYVAYRTAPSVGPGGDGSEFKIGDRVRAAGKRGVIAFIGETEFAPGEWAGIVLDDTVGMQAKWPNRKSFYFFLFTCFASLRYWATDISEALHALSFARCVGRIIKSESKSDKREKREALSVRPNIHTLYLL